MVLAGFDSIDFAIVATFVYINASTKDPSDLPGSTVVSD